MEMRTKIIPAPTSDHIYDPFKKPLSNKIENRLLTMQRQRKLFRKRGSQNVALRKHKTQVFCCQVISKESSSIFNDGNISATALMPYIDSAMKLQQNSYEAALATNKAYQIQLLLVFLEAFISIIFNFYYMISVIVAPSAFKLSIFESLGYLAQHLIQPCSCVLVIVFGFSLVKYNFRKSQKIVNKIIIHAKDNEIRARFLAFSQQIQSNSPSFTVFSFFSLDGSVIFSMISATTTYLIILVQTLGSQSQIDPILSAYANKANQSLKP